MLLQIVVGTSGSKGIDKCGYVVSTDLQQSQCNLRLWHAVRLKWTTINVSFGRSIIVSHLNMVSMTCKLAARVEASASLGALKTKDANHERQQPVFSNA